MYDNTDLLALVDQIPYEERASGSDTTKELARMLAEKATQKMARSKEFQAESKEKNRTMFSAPQPQLEGPPPGSALVQDSEMASEAAASPQTGGPEEEMPEEENSDSFELGDL